jgi:hypothetical protein
MHVIRYVVEMLLNAFTPRPTHLAFLCTGCELQEDCRLPASRRRALFTVCLCG